MILNADQILEEGLIILDSNSHGKPAQVGFDLSIKAVNQTGGNVGKVLVDKTIVSQHTAVQKTSVDGKLGWMLYAGVYDVIMNEGCNIAPNRVGLIRQRSSLMRNGALIQSSIFDPGFKTDNVGTYMFVNNPIFIEENARVAQMYFHDCTPVGEDKLYNGQFQNDKQR
jgi:deoxycytidine triphosphate deaminase